MHKVRNSMLQKAREYKHGSWSTPLYVLQIIPKISNVYPADDFDEFSYISLVFFSDFIEFNAKYWLVLYHKMLCVHTCMLYRWEHISLLALPFIHTLFQLIINKLSPRVTLSIIESRVLWNPFLLVTPLPSKCMARVLAFFMQVSCVL